MKLLLLLPCLLLVGCVSTAPRLKTVERVDLARFMGPWYVIAAIPTFIETEAYNAVEDYRLAPDGTIATTFTFRQGGFDGPAKRYTPRGFVVDRINNSTWAMQFVWPFKAEFLITHLDPDYTRTVIGRNKRDYVWIMARTPQLPEDDYRQLVAELAAQGYDVAKLRLVPQQWPELRGREPCNARFATSAGPRIAFTDARRNAQLGRAAAAVRGLPWAEPRTGIPPCRPFFLSAEAWRCWWSAVSSLSAGRSLSPNASASHRWSSA